MTRLNALFRRLRGHILAGLFTAAGLFFAVGIYVEAWPSTTVTVTNTNDNGLGSLREALSIANDGDEITFAVTGAIDLTGGELLINKNITVTGPGASMLTVSRAQGASNFRIFHITPGHTVTIQGLTITRGYTNFGPVAGGGIFNDHSNVTVNRCVVTDNSARGQGGFSGGGIGNYGAFSCCATLTINDSVISNNNVKDGITSNIGGGIFNNGLSGSATVTINNSTISGNQAFQGGGVFSDGGVPNSTAVLTVNNSTFSNNYADQYAGGIMNEANEGGQATVTVINSTFAGNSSCGTCNFWAGAIFNDGNWQPGGALLHTYSTIFKGNPAAQRNIVNQGGIVDSEGYNLTNDAGVQNTNGGTGDLTGPGDQINADPLLGPLQDNGGPTFTHALLNGSPAIDAGDPAFTPPPFFDQRGAGFSRVANGSIDKGSFEVQGPTATPSPGCSPVVFTNPTTIDIPDAGPGNPYPSNITVTGIGGTVTKVTVKLFGLNHGFPDDIDVLLVGPSGQNATIMSDAGGSTFVNGVTLTLDDAAATPLPDQSPLTTGTYQPANYEGNEIFPPPAPTPLGNSALSTFNGINPNGIWSLYVKDDGEGFFGSFAGGWELDMQTTNTCGATPTATATATPSATPTFPACGGQQTVGTSDFDNVTPPTLPPGWTATNGIDPDGVFWQTSNSGLPSPPAVSLPNALWVNAPAARSDKYLVANSPTFFEDSWAQLRFSQNFNFENGFDGGVLELSDPSVNGGAFTDITDPAIGGSFVMGGYNSTISAGSDNPLAGRQAWSGNSNGFMYTIVNLRPLLINGRFRWRVATNTGQSGEGWRVDNVTVAHCHFFGTPTATATAPITGTPTFTPTNTPTNTPTVTPTFTPTATNTPTATPTCTLTYTYTVGPGSIDPGTIDIGNHTNDGSTIITLPFPFTLYDQTFTSVAAGSNGHLTFGTVYDNFLVACMPVSQATYAIGPYWTDQCTRTTGTPNCGNLATNGIFTSVSGGAPNRILNIEYRTTYFGHFDQIDYEVRIYEGRTDFDLIYGAVPVLMSPNDSALSVGVQRNNASGQSTVVGCDPTGGQAPPVTAGLRYHFTLGFVCGTPTPTATATATFSPTNTPTSTPTNTPTSTPTNTPTNTPTSTPTYTPTSTPTSTPTATATATNTPTATPTVMPPTDSRADFDGDGRTDLSVFRPSNGYWYYEGSVTGFHATQFGESIDIPAPADFDNDHKTDISVFRPSTGFWYRLNSSDGTFYFVNFGLNGDIPQAGDYDGDGTPDQAVFRPSSGTWYWLRSIDGQYAGMQFGQNGDKPVAGDYDGDGRMDLGVFRGGIWYRFLSATSTFVGEQFGIDTDMPVQADYDGDDRDDVAVFRPAEGNWYFHFSANGQYGGIHWGQSGDVPVPGDYDADNRSDVAVYREGTWFLNQTTAGSFAAAFGLPADTPIPKKYIP